MVTFFRDQIVVAWFWCSDFLVPGLKYHTTNGSGETIAIKDILKDKTATLESKHFPICLHLQVGTFCWSFEHLWTWCDFHVCVLNGSSRSGRPRMWQHLGNLSFTVLLFDFGDVEKRDPKAASCHKTDQTASQWLNDFTMILMGQQSLWPIW